MRGAYTYDQKIRRLTPEWSKLGTFCHSESAKAKWYGLRRFYPWAELEVRGRDLWGRRSVERRSGSDRREG